MLDFKTLPAFCALSLLAACGGGGGGGTTTSAGGGGSTTTTAPATMTAFLVDGPAKGVSYACAPSGTAGVTGADGAFTCAQADTSVSFSLVAGGGTINLGSVSMPTAAGTSVPVSALQVGTTNVGLKAAEILQALNHGTDAAMDVSGLTLPGAAVTDINSYIASAGTLPAGQVSDDQFLASVQSRATGGTSFTHPVTGTASTFMQTVVVPHLQATVVAISQTNPAPVLRSDSTTHLSGTIVTTGSGTIPATANCSQGTWSTSGGGILNAVVKGNIQQPGTYAVNFYSPGFQQTTTFSAIQCTTSTGTVVIPGSTQSSQVPPVNGTDNVTVSAGFGGTNLSLGSAQVPAGCTGGQVTGTNVGASNPLITLSVAVSCATAAGNFSVQGTAKLVGAP